MKEQFIREVLALGAEEPRRVDMLTWADMLAMGDGTEDSVGGVPRLYPDCGTAGCLYGWGRLLAHFGSKEALIAELTRFNRPNDGGFFEADEELEGLYHTIRSDGGDRESVAQLFDLSVDEADRLTLVEC